MVHKLSVLSFAGNGVKSVFYVRLLVGFEKTKFTNTQQINPNKFSLSAAVSNYVSQN